MLLLSCVVFSPYYYTIMYYKQLYTLNIFRCSSPVGRPSGETSPRIRLARGCRRAIPAHEIFHALGRWHEQSRPDRDEYVWILLDNIRNPSQNKRTMKIFNIQLLLYTTEYKHNFHTRPYSDTQGVPYDFDSLMHYRATAFAKPGKLTIIPKDPNIDLASLGQHSHLSTWDMLQINIRYCPGCSLDIYSYSVLQCPCF